MGLASLHRVEGGPLVVEIHYKQDRRYKGRRSINRFQTFFSSVGRLLQIIFGGSNLAYTANSLELLAGDLFKYNGDKPIAAS